MTTREATARTNGQSPNGDRVPIFAELGVHTTEKIRRSLYEDFLTQLSGTRAAKTYREMADNDATVGQVLLGMEMLLRRMSWSVEPGEETAEGDAAAAFVEECMDDMSHTWQDLISSVVTMLPYGWAWFELVYKRRMGEDGDPASKYDDGRVGWRKIAYRAQATALDFDTDPNGGVRGMWQQLPNGQRVFLPIEKSLLFRTTATRGATGRSVLRNAYRSWYFRKHGEESLMVGVRRNLAGIPKASIPARNVLAADATYTAVKDIVTRLHVDEQAGVVWFSDRDETGNPLYELELMTAGGTSEAIGAAIAATRMFAQDIAASLLASFAGLGRDAVGSRALADPLIDLFRTSLEATADMMQETLNRYAVPRLMRFNTFTTTPKLVHGELRERDLAAVGAFIKDTFGAGLPWLTGDPAADAATMREMREMAGLEPLDVDELPALSEMGDPLAGSVPVETDD